MSSHVIIFILDRTGDLGLVSGSSQNSIENVQNTIVALERTQHSLSNTSGRSLRTHLHRQVEARRRELSVIVNSPSTSTPDPTLVDQNHSSFFGGESSAIQPPEYYSITTPFEIYEDPEPAPGRPNIIVSAPSASTSVGKENIEPEFLESNIMGDDNEEAVAKLKDLETRSKKTMAKLKAKLEIYNPAKYPAPVLRLNQAVWHAAVTEDYTDLCQIMSEFDEVVEDEDAKADIMKGYDLWTENINKFFLTYSNKLLSSNEASTSSQGSSSRQAALASVKVDKEKLNLDIKALSAEIRSVENWSAADSSEVEIAMNRVESWKTQFKDIRNTFYSIKKLVITHSITGVNLSGSEAAVFNLEAEMEVIIDNIYEEDVSRALYSLSRSKSADVKYPQFSGSEDEDYNKFEREFLAALKANKVKQVDKIKKL